jgi:two-component system NtrC family response regulator
MSSQADSAPVWLGEDAALARARARLLRVAPSRLPVLVLGETGTGKELAARTVHAASAVAPGPFVALDCGALPDALLESELFGSARGAFTGALAARAGLVEAAHGGTLFLDEIGDASALLQQKLLRFLAEGEYRRLGESRLRRADVRLVAATHRDLAGLVRAGRFRADLWYRLAAVEVELPPLRARGPDVLFLARAFLVRGRADAWWDAAARVRLARYAWPGNVRELAWVAEAAALFAGPDGRVGEDALPARLRGAGEVARGGAGAGLRGQVEDLERARILDALDQSGGNRSRAARRLGLSRSGLWKKLKRVAPPEPGRTREGEEAWQRKS